MPFPKLTPTQLNYFLQRKRRNRILFAADEDDGSEFLSNLAVEWWRADKGLTLRDDTYVSKWTGQNLGIELDQATEANQPNVVESSSDFNDQQVLDLSASRADRLLSAAVAGLDITSPFTLLTILNFDWGSISSNFPFAINCSQADMYAFRSGGVYDEMRWGMSAASVGLDSKSQAEMTGALSLATIFDGDQPDSLAASIASWVHHYPLQEDLLDAKGSADGSFLNPSGAGDFERGWAGGIYRLDGSSSQKRPQFTIPSSVWTSNSGNWTLTWWMYLDDDQGTWDIAVSGRGTGGAAAFEARFESGNRPQVTYRGGTGGAANINANNGHGWFCELRRNGSETKLSVISQYDGTWTSIRSSATDISGDIIVTIGGDGLNETYNSAIRIADLRIFNDILTTTQRDYVRKGTGKSLIWLDGGAGSVDTPFDAHCVMDRAIGLNSASYPFDGQLAEFLIVEGRISLDDLNAWGDYIVSRYGVDWTTAT